MRDGVMAPTFEQGMYDLDGFVEVSCQQYEDFLVSHPNLHVSSSVTDPDGVYGSPLVYTEWYETDEGGPLCRSYLRGPRDGERKCDHWIAKGVA